MNVLIIGTTDKLGGAAKVSWDIKTMLETRGHTVHMFVADKHSADENVRVIPRHKWRKVLGFLLATESFISSDWIIESEEFKKADIIHCHNIHGRFFNLKTLQKMSQIKPVVWTLHDEWALTPHCAYTLETSNLKNGLYTCPTIDIPPRILWDNSVALAKEKSSLYEKSKLTVVTPSVWLKNKTEKTVLGNQDVRLIPNGIDASTFVQTKKMDAREKLNLPKNKKIVLFLATAGKANTWKGWRFTEKIIDHHNKNTDILFLNVGNLTEEKPEENIEYRLHVNNPKELALYYSAADVLLFTSIAENFPLVILEAMSCGLPIVAFDVGGVAEVLTHKENGFVAQYKNEQDLIEGMNWVLNLNQNSLTELSLRSCQKIKKEFDIDIMTSNYLQLYNSLIKQ